MHRLIVLLLPLAAMLLPSRGQEEVDTGNGIISREIQKEIVDKHNEFRRKVTPTASNMLKMSWNEKVAKNAEKSVKKCNANPSPEEDRTVDGFFCGETLFQATYANSWSEVITLWHKTGSNFKYGIGAVDSAMGIGGYTQIVWYNSHQIGCAITYCPGTDFPFLHICQYCPIGNLVNKLARPYKEGPSCGDCPNNCEEKLCTNPCLYVDTTLNCKELEKLFTCENPLLKDQCQATCKCKTQIK